MNTEQLTEINVGQAKRIYSNARYIDDDLLLFEKFGDVPFPEEAVRVQCLFLALCTNGKAQYSVDTRERQVTAGDAIIINEGQVVSNCMFSRDCNGIAIMMSYDFFREIISDIHELSSLFLFSRTHPVFHLHKNETKTLLEYFYLIQEKVEETTHHFRRELVTSLIKSLIYDMSNAIYRIQQLGNGKKTRAESIFTEFIKLVEQNFREERRVSWYAEQLCITPKYLSETIKVISKRTPNEWIDNYVILEMRVLLKNSTLSIKEIAQTMHFPNQSFLGKYFKEHVGMSPSEYRKS